MAEPVDLCNRALYALGATAITSLTDGSTNATLCSALYAKARDAVYTDHDWPELIRRAQLVYTDQALTLSSGDVGTGVTATTTSAWAATDVGRYLYENDSTGVAIITGYTSAAEVTVEVTTAFTDTTLAANAWRIAPLQGFEVDYGYEYVSPTGILKVVEATEDATWKKEGTRVLADTSDLVLSYIYQQTDFTALTVPLYEAVVSRLALELAIPITGKEATYRLMDGIYQIRLAEAKGLSNTQADHLEAPMVTTFGRSVR